MTQYRCQSVWDDQNYNTLTLELTSDMVECVALEIHDCKKPYALHYLYMGTNNTEIRQSLTGVLTPVKSNDHISHFSCNIPCHSGYKLIFKTPIRCKAFWTVQTKS